ncbi:MAG: hypothetical protein QM770_05650 [Tepidisphaeraceae bacterium]
MSSPKRILVLRNEDSPGTVRAQQLEPLHRFETRLRMEAKLTFEHAYAPTLEAIESTVSAFTGDVAFVMVHFSHDPNQVRAMFERLHARNDRPALVFHDCFDQSASLFWDSLPFVDRYAKKILLRDLSSYERPTFGGFVVSDYLREHGFDYPEGWRAGVTMPAGPDPSKIVLAWNFAAAGAYATRAGQARLLQWLRRPIDLNVRFAPTADAPNDWYKRYRLMALDAARRVPGVRLSGTDRVGRWRYGWDQLRSRAILSPFGHGEICLRDIEAFAAGAALIKPSVEHLRISGNFFEPGVTYVPVKWDFSDLPEATSALLADSHKITRMTREARRRFDIYQANGWFDDVVRVFDGLERY